MLDSLKLLRNAQFNLRLALLAGAVASSLLAVAKPQDAADPTQTIAEKLRPSLVRIRVIEKVTEGGKELKREAFGSGVIISPEGYVVTNHHVAGDATWLDVTFSDKTTAVAHLVGTDALSDIAVIKLDPRPDGKLYPAAPWGDSDKLHIGQHILAMGSPFAFSQSVTAGIISNTELILPEQMAKQMELDGEDVGSIVRWIGHDAQISPGNSGGPLVDLQGQIVGINEINVGLSGAIPANLAKEMANQIIAKGHVARAYLGLELQPRLTGDPDTTGALVSNVIPRSPAATAGLKPGDKLLSVGAVNLDVAFKEQVPLANFDLSRLAIGQATPVKYKRDGTVASATITPDVNEPALLPEVELISWGLTASNLTPAIARDADLETREGVIVTGVEPGAAAATAQPPLATGDVIVHLGKKPIKDVSELKAAVAGVEQSDTGTVMLVEIYRGGEHLLSAITFGQDPQEDTSAEVAHAWLPVETQPLTPTLVKAMELPDGTKGVRVTKIYPEAKGLGLQVGDVLSDADGTPIDANSLDQTTVFDEIIRQYKVGSEAKLSGFRESKPFSVTVKLLPAKKRERELPKYIEPDLGMTLRSLSFEDRDDPDDPTDGVIVTDVVAGSWAYLAEISTGDVIQQVNGVKVKNLQELKSKLESLKAAHTGLIVLFVVDGAHASYVEMRTEWDKK